MLKTGHHLSDDEIRARYESLTHRGSLGKEFYERLLDLAGNLSGLKVLDVGCGYGALLGQISAQVKNCELFGVDFSISRLKTASSQIDSIITLVEANIQETLPFSDAYFDRIFCTETLEHLKHPERCLREMTRILKPDGRAIITIPNATGFAPFHLMAPFIPGTWLRGKLLPYEHPSITDQPIDTCYVYEEIMQLIWSSGFKIESIDGYRYFRYLQMLPIIRHFYRVAYPAVEWVMPKINGARFAYNLFLRCFKA